MFPATPSQSSFLFLFARLLCLNKDAVNCPRAIVNTNRTFLRKLAIFSFSAWFTKYDIKNAGIILIAGTTCQMLLYTSINFNGINA